MDGIAEGNTLRFHNILVSWCIPELNKVDFDVNLRLGQVGRVDIVLGKFSQCVLRRFLLKVTGAVQHSDFLIWNKLLAHQHYLFRQFHDFLCFAVHPIRMHTCDGVLDGFFHLEVSQILAVGDVDIMIRTSGLMELDQISIPLEFSIEGIQHRSIHAAQTVTKRGWNPQRKGCTGIHIRPDIEWAVGSRMTFQSLHCSDTPGH